MGIHAPIEHQRVIAKLIARLGTMYYDLKTISLKPLTKTMIDETKTSPVPDVRLCDHERETVPVIIEITRTRTVNADMKKISALITAAISGLLKDSFMIIRKTTGTSIKKALGL